MKNSIKFTDAFIVAEAINNSNNTSATFNRMKEIFNEVFNEAKEQYRSRIIDGDLNDFANVAFEFTPRQNELFNEIFNTLCYVNNICKNANPNNKSYDEIEFEIAKKGFDMMVEYFHLEEYAWEYKERDRWVKSGHIYFMYENETYIKKQEPTVEAEVEPTHKPMSVSPMASAVEMSLIYNMHKEGVNVKIDGWDCNTLFIIVENSKDALKVMDYLVQIDNFSDMRYIKETNTVMVRFE